MLRCFWRRHVEKTAVVVVVAVDADAAAVDNAAAELHSNSVDKSIRVVAADAVVVAAGSAVAVAAGSAADSAVVFVPI